MELPSKLLEQIIFNTTPKNEEHILIVTDKSTLEEHLSQPLQTDNKQFKIAITFLTGFNGIFNATNSKNKFYLTRPIDDDDFSVIQIPPGAYDIENLTDEFKRNIIKECHVTESDYPFTIKPNFSTLGSITETSIQGSFISFLPNDSVRDLLGFNETTLYEECNLSHNLVDILSFDNCFLETVIARGMTLRKKRSGIIHVWTMTVDPGDNYV